MSRLGAGFAGASITERNGRIVWQSAPDTLTSASFSRELSETSHATVSIQAPGRISDLVEPWVHQLHLWRDGQLVWTGPILETIASRTGLTVSAADATAYFDRRRIVETRRWGQVDAAEIMRATVEDSIGFDDPCHLVEGTVVEPSRVWTVLEVEAGMSMLSEAVDDLVDAGLVWTVAAGRLIIGPLPGMHTTAILSDRHIGGDITVSKLGKDVITDAQVTGKGVWGQYGLTETPVGVLQGIVKADSVVTYDEATRQARKVVEESMTPPRRLTIGSDSHLSPDAPVTLEELVPGVRVPVSSSQTGVRLGSEMMLEKLDVSWSDQGEQVKVSLSEPYELPDSTVAPPPIEHDYRSPWAVEQAKKERTQSTNPDEEDEMNTPPSEGSPV